MEYLEQLDGLRIIIIFIIISGLTFSVFYIFAVLISDPIIKYIKQLAEYWGEYDG